MLFTREVVQVAELLQKRGGARVDRKFVEKGVLLLISGASGCGIDVQQLIMLLCTGENCAIEVTSAQRTSFPSRVATRCFAVSLFDKPESCKKVSRSSHKAKVEPIASLDGILHESTRNHVLRSTGHSRSV